MARFRGIAFHTAFKKMPFHKVIFLNMKKGNPMASNVYKYRCKIVRIIDGDTVVADVDLGFEVELKAQKIRLYGINTPESRTRDKEEKKRGLEAKWRLTELLDTGEFYLESHDKGKFGRILGVLYQTDDFSIRSINQILVDEGHAVEYFGGKR